jgi:malate dehydrogenase (oxaloacetate-decarboxylating)
MAERAIVFALANPEPQVDPLEASRHATVVATGRSDFPNQINNVLAFPGVFRGLIDARSSEVTTVMLLAASKALAAVVGDDELNPAYIIPSVFNAEVHHAVAAAVRRAAGGSAHVENADDEHRMAEPSTHKRSGSKREAQLSGSAPAPAARS